MAPENTYKWVQDRLRELHSGALSGDDLRQLNTLAKEDPFIADALEGFASHPDHSHDATLDRLASRIRPVKLARRRWLIPNLTVTAVAASLMIIIGFWAVMYRMQQNNNATVAESHEVILSPENDTAAGAMAYEESTPAQSESTTLQKEDEYVTERPGDVASRDNRVSAKKATDATVATKKEESNSSITTSDDKLSPPGAASTTPPAAPATTQSEVAIVMADQDVKDDTDPMYFANQMDPALFARRAAGRVVSESGEPLIGATLNIRNTNLGTVSDLDGKFELFLPAPASTVDITFSGYEGTAVELRQRAEDVAILLPESNINRANAKNYQSTTVQESAGAGTPQQTSYVDYLRSNSRFPLKDNLYTPGRNVTVQFEVDASGKPTRTRVSQSSNDRQLDEEALRLIRKGPAWVCEGNKFPCEMEYTIYFR